MSENTRPTRDAGMTITEVLVAVMVTGILVAAMAMATSVMLRQTDNTGGRLNNARSEQSVGVWMPSDLASAEEVNTDEVASPCGASCPPGINVGGSNALMLTWTGSIPGATEAIPTRTTVSYRYVQVGDEWQVIRVSCLSVNGAAPTCEQAVVLHDVLPPPPGVEYYPGSGVSPTWVLLVTLAVDPADPGDGTGDSVPEDPTYYVKNGRRVTVTINGGGDISGAGGGQDQITLSAGGTNRETDLSTTNLSATPTFSATRSRCGGNFGLLVDTSGSIGSNMSYVRSGISAFISAFAGTPVKLQVVRFSTTASTLGSGAGWARYFDMLVDADVAELNSLVSGLAASGGTNWEDGMFRMFLNSDATVQQVLPDSVIFFTDGMPTYNRLNSTSATAPAVADPADSGLAAGNGSSYNQLSWNRANRIARQYEVDLERLIGVYVGVDVNGTSTWLTQGAGYHLIDFKRGYHPDYQRGSHLTNIERGYHLNYERAGSGLTYEKKTGSTWGSTSRSSYESSNSVPGDSDGWRARVTGALGSWTSTTSTNYTKSNLTADSTDGFRAVVSYTSPFSSWEATTEAAYTAGNTSWGSGDGWDAVKQYTVPFTLYESPTSSTRSNRDILKDVIAPSGVVPAVPTGGPYTNASEATYYELPAWTQFSGAMTSLALAECGGTVTLQTKVGASSAADPFTYQNSVDLTTATTSALYRSGTFDYDLSGGGTRSATITPMPTSTLANYNPVGWSCKSGGATVPFTTTPIAGGPWTSITLTVSPNQAISCVNQVVLK